jgi:hypothetical protein
MLTLRLPDWREGEDERFQAVIEACGGSDNAVLLFPDDTAITIDEFLERRDAPPDPGAPTSPEMRIASPTEGVRVAALAAEEKPLIVIAVDATWKKARKMMHHFTQCVSAAVPHVCLKPTTASIYARTQSESGRPLSTPPYPLLPSLLPRVHSRACPLTLSCVLGGSARWRRLPFSFRRWENNLQCARV